MTETKRIDGHGCAGCYNYKVSDVSLSHAPGVYNPKPVHYCRIPREKGYVNIRQGAATIYFHYEVIYNPEVRLWDCPLDRK